MTSTSSPFPPFPQNAFGPDDVVRYLSSLQSEGHQIYSDSGNSSVYYIEVNDSYRIRVSAVVGHSQVQLHYLQNTVAFHNVNSVAHLEQAVAGLANRIPGISWPFRPISGRLKEGSPSSNNKTISLLIGHSQVEAIFDPYLTNGGLDAVVVALSFGNGHVGNPVRLLGSDATTQGKISRFTKAGVDAWLRQLNIAGEARIIPARTEHRRFMLLDNGQSLIMGHSWNDIHKNEAVRVESDAQDRPFFDTCWASAVPLT